MMMTKCREGPSRASQGGAQARPLKKPPSKRLGKGGMGQRAGLGSSEDDLKRGPPHNHLRHIRDKRAPIVIHSKPRETETERGPIQHLAKDTHTHCRNQIETRSSNGALDRNVRAEWEALVSLCLRGVGDICDEEGVAGFDRVECGVLNVSNHPTRETDRQQERV